MKSPDDWSCDFRYVLNEELTRFDREKEKAKEAAAIGEAGIQDNGLAAAREKPTDQTIKTDAQDPIARAHEKQLVGLAFSGGGIRSATFNLGVLQSLARMKLLSRFNYLSTVSGGGYIGSWLMAWIKRQEMKAVARDLIPEWVNQPGRKEPPEIHFLRRFSNYLTPKLGWLGADTWTVVAIYLRNLILNFIVLAAAFAFVLLIPRLIVLGSIELFRRVPLWVLTTGASVALGLAAFWIILAMRYFATRRIRDNPRSNLLDRISKWKRIGWIIHGIRNFVTRKSPDEPTTVTLPDIADWKKIDRIAWYPSKLFDRDFILRVEFELKAPGDRYIYVWTPMKRGRTTRGADGAAAKILVSGEEAISPSREFKTGSINSQPPVRRAEVLPGLNKLKVICSEERCTVYVNDLTLNTLRVNRQKAGGLLRFIPYWRTFLAIGVQDDQKSIAFRSVTVEKVETPSDTGSTQGQVQRRIIAPLFLAAFLATYLFGFVDLTRDGVSHASAMGEAVVLDTIKTIPWGWEKCAAVAGLTLASLVFGLRVLHKSWIFIVFVFSKVGGWIKRLLERWRWISPRKSLSRRWPVQRDTSGWAQIARETISMGFAAAIGGLIVRALYVLFSGKTPMQVTPWGTPALIVAFLVTIIFHIGFMGRAMQDERREWWGRLSAWLLIYLLAWIAIFGLAFYAPSLLRWATSNARVWLSAISTAWILSTLSGLFAARSAAAGIGKSNKLVELIAKVAPYVFVVGFFFLLSWAVAAVLPLIAQVHLPFEKFRFLQQLKALAIQLKISKEWWPPLFAAVTSGVIALLLSWRLDINQFSMHLLYRNRLGRCYLGASNRLRRAQPFTGFSANDDFMLSELASLPFGHPTDSAPYPIISAALNLVGGKELAWQQRKAASFMFSPLYCGYDFAELPPGYCATTEFANKPPPVISLATAMAISGAAASPNMGYHTSPAPAFLMTVFNVRLGWWLGNPRHKSGYEKSGPLNVLLRLTCELFGMTSEEGKYVYLSDGGHFENLGIYELVRRRCRFIVACDAEEDHSFGFGGLGNAIEKCRSDFGIDIDIDVEPIRRRSEKGHSQWHCAIGRVFYSRVDRDGKDGLLVYLKSSLTGDEPTDALRYAAANPEFPHQSTADQWFDESQFESYRVLGYHIVQNVFLPLGDADTIAKLRNEEIFVRLSQHWYPPSAATTECFTRHVEAIVAIYNELRTNKHLQFLNRDIYPEWRILFDDPSPPFPGLAFERPGLSRGQLPKSDDELRAGFYICTSACDLFEAVYVDLRLEEEFDHPDNRGWMNFFRHWSSTPMFRVTWAIGAGNYGARFQSFCQRHLNLKPGRSHLAPLKPEKRSDDDENVKWTSEIGKISKKIVDTIWTWLADLEADLEVGSEIIAKAALIVSEEVPGFKIVSDRNEDRERKLRKDARTLIKKELDRAETEGRFQKKNPETRDEEWYDAATLIEFLRRKIPEERFSPKWPAKVANLALTHAAAIASHVLSKSFQTELNPIERELIELFFIFHPRLAASAQIIRLESTPGSREQASSDPKQALCFPVGFAILAKTEWPLATNKCEKLVYLRVQNHLRTMGLARSALKQLIREHPDLDVEPKRMHPEACEVPRDIDYNQLKRLFYSAQTEVKAEALEKTNM